MDPNQQPQPQQTPQAQQPYAQPQYQPANYAQPQKSHTGLIIGLILGGVALLAIIGTIIVVVIMVASSKTKSAVNPPVPPLSTSNSKSAAPDSKTMVAEYTSDLKNVCKGVAISNAATFTTRQSAIIETFQLEPESTSWVGSSAAYGKPYYNQNYKDFVKVSVVACVKATTGPETTAIDCTTKDGVTIHYHAASYAVSFYEAKTAKKIADGGTITASPTTCPFVTTYNKQTMNAYAYPPATPTVAALDRFVK